MQLWLLVAAAALVVHSPRCSGAQQPVEPICTTEGVGDSALVYCSGALLESVGWCMRRSGAHFGNDSKAFVDRPLKTPPREIQSAFSRQFPSPTGVDCAKLSAFVDAHMERPGHELDTCRPADWRRNPARIAAVADRRCGEFATSVNAIWKQLCRKVPARVQQNASLHSLIYVPHEFIAPGGRFREYYYWDTFWIIKGLLVSGMRRTARGQILNLVEMVRRFGFVPNGGRVYYTRRSQPPFLALMAYHYYIETNDVEFVKQIHPTLEMEFDYWMKNCSRPVKNHTVFQYKTPANQPRPESYKEDVKLAEGMSQSDKRRLWRNVASTAMSGIDFSSRWTYDRSTFAGIETTSIVPVDLNAIMCQNMEIIAFLAEVIGKSQDELRHNYGTLRDGMRDAMKTLFYNEEKKAWFDHWLDHSEQKTDYYASSVVPIYANCYEHLNVPMIRGVYRFMKDSGALSLENGVPYSMRSVKWGQWDYPYAWPPQMHMTVEAFRKTDDAELQEAAFHLAQKYVNANYKAFLESFQSAHCPDGCMYEKLNVSDPTPGVDEQGEYPTQIGFGWTNGAVLSLIDAYSDRITCEPPPPSTGVGHRLYGRSAACFAPLFATLSLGVLTAYCLQW